MLFDYQARQSSMMQEARRAVHLQIGAEVLAKGCVGVSQGFHVRYSPVMPQLLDALLADARRKKEECRKNSPVVVSSTEGGAWTPCET